MWLLPFLLIGAVLYAAGRERGAYGAHRPQPVLPPPPGPISVLGEFVRIGQTPPPPVIICAIAEAESLGRCDLADDIVNVFIVPVVAQNDRLYRPGPMPGTVREVPVPPGPATQMWPPEANYPGFDARFGANERSRRGEAPPNVQERVYPPIRAQRRAPVPYERGSCARPQSPRAAADEAHQAASASPTPTPQQLAPRYDETTTMDEIQRMVDADAERSIAAMRATTPTSATPPIETITIGRQLPGDFNTQPGSDWDNEFPPGHPLSSQPDVMPYNSPMMASPVAGVPDEAWAHFCDKLVRETPAYQSARHVGQYRQNRERLIELGIDPNGLIGSVEMQRAALDADLADAYRHATDDSYGDGIVRNHVNRKIVLPRQAEPTTITLSGVLGVIQAAGLEGAVGWFNKTNDRKKFPHTTQAFARTNGVF